MNILILAVAPFADAAMLVGPLAVRRELLRDDRITVVTTAGAAEVVRALGIADEVWEVGATGRAPRDARDAYRTASMLLKARKGRFGSVIDLFPKPLSMVAALAATGGRSITASPRYGDLLLGSRAAAFGHDDPIERIAGLIGVATVAAELLHTIDPESHVWVERALGAIGYDGGPVVSVVSTGLWPVERFVDVASRLRDGYQAWIVALDAPRGERNAPKIAEALGGHVLGVASPAGSRFLAALARSSVLVTDDLGAAAIATLLGVPSVVVAASGARLPTLHDRVVLTAPEAQHIDPDSVLDAASKLVGKSRTSQLFQNRSR